MSEAALLTAVRDRIRAETNFGNDYVQIEFDSMPAAKMVKDFVMVIPGGWTVGENHRGGYVEDLIYSVDVEVVTRLPKPRDKRRELFLDNLSGLNERLRQVMLSLNFSYDVNNAANDLIAEWEQSAEGFIEPLQFANVDPRPQAVGSEYFAGVPGDSFAGIKRAARFQGARRIRTVTQ